jgi:ABC-2 type transport system ATP-binding protein
MRNAIETHQLTKRYGSLCAVDALDLCIQQGELFALLGVNGAGKTTTIKMLTCLTRPTDGDALLMGHSVVHAPQLVKPCINLSPQETAIAPHLTALENLAFIAGLYGANSAQAKQRAQESIEAMGLQSVAHRRAKTLSGGWQRRLSIAMALISQPQILFLDEPTLGLDVLARRALWQQIQALKGHITIVLTTHYLEEAEALADRIGIMSGGKLRAVDTPLGLMAQAHTSNLEDAFIALSQQEGSSL